MILRWFLSRTVRQAHHVCRHVEKLIHHQRDLLSPPALEALNAEVTGLRKACATGTKAELREGMTSLERAANKWLKPYPHAAWRENIEVMLVAIAVAMGIRTFFLQPFKIPTGSMQPTLYGVTQEDLRGTDVAIPNRISRFFQYWFNGVSYFHVVAKDSGTLTYDEPSKFVLFNLKQNYYVNNVRQGSVWFPPDDLFRRGGMPLHAQVQAGQDIVKLRVISGDHLFVDRFTYNFRRPNRGEIVVFETHGIRGIVDPSGLPQDTYYIKRLCGLGNETIQLSKDYLVTGIPRPDLNQSWAGHMIINGTREITANTPPFENLYSFPDATSAKDKTIRYHENHYVGHGLVEALAPGLRVHVRPDHYFVMGDNTFNSSDSRYWGDFPREKVIGKSFFVYWPIGGTEFKGEPRVSRFGWSHR